ncbi:MAG: ferric reductase-like transmembrane domain-containing protein [Pseudomonadota bacterium]
MGALRRGLIWLCVLAVIAVPLVLAANSPLLAWRQPVYIVAGFAGIAALGLLVLQPLLAAGLLPGLPILRSRRLHRYLGIALLLSIALHVGGLWVFSPPDVVDALTFASPTPFSVWGVIAMWAIFAAACLAALRKRAKLRVTTWRRAHTGLALIAVAGTVAHALLIEGAMEPVSKGVLSAAALLITAKVIYDSRIWHPSRRTKRTP